MGSGSSKKKWRQDSLSSRSDSSVSSDQGLCFLYGQESYSYPPQQICSSDFAYPQPRYYSEPPPEPVWPPSKIYGGSRKMPKRSYADLADDFTCLEQVVEALAMAGLEACNLVIGIDFTESNEFTGAKSFKGRSLHSIVDHLNPYEQVISTIGKTLGVFSEDSLIPCFGFGDASTLDRDVFSFYPGERFCDGFEEVLSRYREIVPQLKLAGPTSFAPIIEMASNIVEQSGGQYHVLVIIADGKATRSIRNDACLSLQEEMTIKAIVDAGELPLSIIFVGVGDGPWGTMKEFCNNIPARAFNNFQFVNYTEIMMKDREPKQKEIEFVLSAVNELPSQYKATLELGILGRRNFRFRERVPLPPPVLLCQEDAPKPSPLPTPTPTYDSQLCPVCLSNPKDMAFGCGHQICAECGYDLQTCPVCRTPIETRIFLN